MKNIYSLITLIILVVGIPILLSKFSEGSGFCFEREKILSDKELMEVAFQKPFQRAYKLPEDDSIKSYLKNHPNCCSVHQDKGLFNLYGLLSGQRWVTAGFKTLKENTVYFFHASVNSCGELPHRDLVFEIEETGSPGSYFN